MTPFRMGKSVGPRCFLCALSYPSSVEQIADAACKLSRDYEYSSEKRQREERVMGENRFAVSNVFSPKINRFFSLQKKQQHEAELA